MSQLGPPVAPRPILIAAPNLSLDRTIELEALEIGRVHRARATDVRGGGKGANVARALRCVGMGATLVGLSAGRTGKAVEGLLQDEGIETVVVRHEGETRSCLSVLANDTVTVFNEPGPPLHAGTWAEYERDVTTRMAPETILICSGSLPPGAPEDGVARLIAAGRSRGCFTVCDTSGPQLAAALTEGPHVVTPNITEALWVLRREEGETVEIDPQAAGGAADAVRGLVARGARDVIVTAGAAGAAGVIDGESIVFEPHQVAVRNPVGAGDCLVAGIAAGMANGSDLGNALPRALAMAASSCETLPAGLLDPLEVERLLTRLHVPDATRRG